MGFMAGHLVSAPVSRFQIADGTDVKPAHFWSQSPLVNGVRSWHLIIKHDLTHRLSGRTLCVHPSVRVPHRWKLIIKHDLTPGFYGRTLGVRPSVRFPYRLVHRCLTSPLLEPGSTCEWCQKLAIDYKT